MGKNGILFINFEEEKDRKTEEESKANEICGKILGSIIGSRLRTAIEFG
jgi:hypothetical protein